MSRASTPTTLEFAILGLLSTEARSGYDLMNEFATTSLGNYSSSPGAIYPALSRLEKRGLVAGEVDGAQELRPRKVFHPTAEGHRALAAWLTRSIDREDVRRRFEELLLRFAFHYLVGEGATRAFLRQLVRELDAYVRELEEEHARFPESAPPQGRMAFELGIDNYRASARWARRSLRAFEEEAQ